MNTIERTLTLQASLAKVWNAVGTPGGFESWFTCKPIGDWAAGSIVTLQWPSGNVNEIRIVEIREPSRFAYQWHPGGYGKLDERPESQLTTVTFTLRAVGEQTELHLLESGFEAIPDERRLQVLGMNTAGWDEELENIRKFVEA